GGLAFLQILVNNVRWLVLLRGQGFDATLRQTLPLSLMGLFFNYAMPGSVGGDIIKGYYLAQDFPEQKLAAGVSVFMDRLIGFFVMVLSGAIAILAFHDRLSHDPRLVAIGTGTLLAALAFILILAFSLSRRLQAPLRFMAQYATRFPGFSVFERIYKAMHAYRYSQKELLQSLLLSMLNQLSLIAFFYFAAQLLGEGHIPLAVFWFCIPIGVVAQAIPISPAGVGVGQAVFYFLFQAALGEEVQVGTVGITLMQLFQFGLGLIGAWFYLKRSRRRPVEAASGGPV
ncbi:MAG: lysylphosphatidylglycerol synthase transmembrane domain-containing protein, partial [Bdellovibrionales bacterium]|nr:lysylphosphatidylglycerol synthase transmembrane domain-containing protein [Bdellovibrionales bacterium]